MPKGLQGFQASKSLTPGQKNIIDNLSIPTAHYVKDEIIYNALKDEFNAEGVHDIYIYNYIKKERKEVS